MLYVDGVTYDPYLVTDDWPIHPSQIDVQLTVGACWQGEQPVQTVTSPRRSLIQDQPMQAELCRCPLDLLMAEVTLIGCNWPLRHLFRISGSPLNEVWPKRNLGVDRVERQQVWLKVRNPSSKAITDNWLDALFSRSSISLTAQTRLLTKAEPQTESRALLPQERD